MRAKISVSFISLSFIMISRVGDGLLSLMMMMMMIANLNLNAASAMWRVPATTNVCCADGK